MILEKIKNANDIKNIPPESYDALAEEIREFLIQSISKTGGHLASNLGAVELTMALHLFLNLPEDKIIWDVGHQSYTHKLLTGRREGFVELRKFGVTIYAVSRNKNKKIGRGSINSRKKYNISIKKQKKGTKLLFVLSDKYGNLSYSKRKVK